MQNGIKLYKLKKYKEALAYFLSLTPETDEDTLDVIYYTGLCYTRLKNYEDAVMYLEQVVTTCKDEKRVLQTRYLLALIYTSTGRKRMATYELNKLIDAKYRVASVYASLAYIAWDMGDEKTCNLYYEKALKTEPDNVTALNGYGYVLAFLNRDLTKALSLCKKALNFSPSSPACLDSLGFVYYKMGLKQEARKYLEKAYELDSNNRTITEHLKILRGE